MVTTHLALFFFNGASASGASSSGTSFAGYLSVPPYYLFSGFTASGAAVETAHPTWPYPTGRSETREQEQERIRQARIRLGIIAPPILTEGASAERGPSAERRLARVAPQVVLPEIPEPIRIELEALRLTPAELEQIRLEYRDEYARFALAIILMASV